MDQVLQIIPLEKLVPSPTNPRKTFDDVKLGELAESIAKVGVLQPLVVRAHKNGKKTFEVVAGERRFRAATLARAAEVPCIVRELTDVEVLEIQTIENLQRDDVHELEEADGYAKLMKDAGYDVPRIAHRIGKSEKYVYDRVKLLELIPESREIFLSGEITAGHAIILARLTRDDQLRAIGDPKDPFDSGLFDEDYGDEDEEDDLFEDDETLAPLKRRAKTVRQFGDWVRREVRLRVDDEQLPELFPETAASIERAATAKLQVVEITHEYGAQEGVYNPNQWKRADGVEDRFGDGHGKKCDHSSLGVVVLGRSQGTAFLVCVDRKCPVHWKREKASSTGSKKSSSSNQSWQRQQAKYEQERKARELQEARWKKALPTIRERTIDRLKKAPLNQLVDLVLEACRDRGTKKVGDLSRGKTAEDAIRFAAALHLSNTALGEYSSHFGPQELKKIGVDANKIVDEVAPKPKPETPAKKKNSRKAAGARAANRAKKAKKAAKA